VTAAEFANCYGPFPEPILLVGADGTIQAANSGAAELLGRPRRELEGLDVRELATEAPEDFLTYLKASAGTGHFAPGAVTLRAGERTIPCRAEAAAIRGPEEGRRSILLRLRPRQQAAVPFLVLNDRIETLNREVTQRRRSEAAMAEQRTWLATVLTSIADGVLATDSNGRVVFMNRVAENLTGWPLEQAAGRPVGEVFAIVSEATGEPAASPVDHALSEGTRAGLEEDTLLLGRDGRQRSIEDTAAPIHDSEGALLGVVLVFRDITEARRSERQVREAQKLESLGVLAGGIAHDFNNLLTGILGNASLAAEALPERSEVRGMVDRVVEASERAAQLTRQMLAYSGQGQFVIERIDISRAVEELVPLLSMSIPKKVHLRLELGRDMVPVEADPGQIQQVIMNLVLNAAEAIGEDKPGLILVSTSPRTIEAGGTEGHFAVAEVEPGAYVSLEVADTGIGMDEETRKRMFEPFFSTKFTGRGLGMAAVMGIVRGHRGAIQVDSTPGRGTTVRVLLKGAGTARQAGAARQERGALILVVDDEEMVRGMARAALERHGYATLLVNNGKEAVEVCRARAPELALMLLDMTMPEMSGAEALAEIRRIRPDLPAVVLSGYTESDVRRRFAGFKLDGFLQKPFTAGALIHCVRTALAGRGLARAS
jgi:PAS domain S-box-containing protein